MTNDTRQLREDFQEELKTGYVLFRKIYRNNRNNNSDHQISKADFRKTKPR